MGTWPSGIYIHWNGSERVFSQVVCIWFLIRIMWPVSGNDLTDALPTEFYVGSLGVSVRCVESPPGHSKERPGIRTWLLVHLWELSPGISLRRGCRVGLDGFGPGSQSAHIVCVSRVLAVLYGESQSGNKFTGWSPGRKWLFLSLSWDREQERSVFSPFQGPSVCRSGGCRLRSCVNALQDIFLQLRSASAV